MDPWLIGTALVTAALLACIGVQVFVLNRRYRGGHRTLAQRAAHFEATLKAVPDAVIVIDEAGRITLFSPNAERLFGYTEAEAVGRNVAMLMPEPYRRAHDGYLRRYYETGERRIIGIGRLVVGQRRDGTTFPLEIAVAESQSAGTRTFVGIVRDVTERQQTEARLQELQSELVHISRVLAMGEMASALAHELNQPLSAIANYLKGSQRMLERQDTSDPSLASALERATDQALRAGEIIRRVRGFVGREDPERTVVSLSKLVEEAMALALVGRKSAGVEVRLRLDPTVDRIRVDRVQVQQVLINLLRNSIDAMEDTPRRALSVASAAHSGGLVRVEVADTGPGLAPEIRQRLFQPFVSSKKDGMGIGLSISRTIVEAHGGEIWAVDNTGGGTRFCLTLELERDVDGDGAADA